MVVHLIFRFALILLMAPGSSSSWQDEDDRCLPSSVDLDPDAGCVKALTGCVCSVTGSGTVWPAGYCLGCAGTASGTLNCTGGLVKPFQTGNAWASCNGSAAFGVKCPCTGAFFYPFVMTCGSCTEQGF